jgi:hypothetical protein
MEDMSALREPNSVLARYASVISRACKIDLSRVSATQAIYPKANRAELVGIREHAVKAFEGGTQSTKRGK